MLLSGMIQELTGCVILSTSTESFVDLPQQERNTEVSVERDTCITKQGRQEELPGRGTRLYHFAVTAEFWLLSHTLLSRFGSFGVALLDKSFVLVDQTFLFFLFLFPITVL